MGTSLFASRNHHDISSTNISFNEVHVQLLAQLHCMPFCKMASSRGTSSQFQMPRPDAIEELSNLFPPSPKTVEASATRTNQYDQLEKKAGQALEELTTLASAATAGVRSGSLNEKMRQKVWCLMESEIKKVHSDMAPARRQILAELRGDLAKTHVALLQHLGGI
jgi:hypothetical protein